MCVTFADEQAAFLAGALLSQLHKHGLLPAPGTRAKADELTLGWLAGEDDPQLKSMLNGFVEGVRLESPGARVINGVAGSYSSPDKGRAKAEELLGLDINALAVLAGRSGLGAVEAAIAQGRPLVGVDKDQQFLAPKLMLTSIVKRADRAVFEIVKATAQGAFAGNEIITYDLANGGVDIVPPQVWARHAGVRLPAAIERRLAELRLELTRGGIRLPARQDAVQLPLAGRRLRQKKAALRSSERLPFLRRVITVPPCPPWRPGSEAQRETGIVPPHLHLDEIRLLATRRPGIPFQLEDIPNHPEAVLLARQLHGRAAAHFHMQVEHGLPGLQRHGLLAVRAKVHPAFRDPHTVGAQITQGQAAAQGLAVVDVDIQGRGR